VRVYQFRHLGKGRQKYTINSYICTP
jgi:hypothetical protein